MAKDDKKLDKITITRGVVFDKEPRLVGDVIDVTDDSRHAAEVLIRNGKAVEGAVKMSSSPANKQVGAGDLDKK